jgi:hypothetical protein
MGITWLEGQHPAESWCVLDQDSIREAVEARWNAMLRAALYTIMPQYLHDASTYSHRLTLVFSGPLLLAFAFLNVELVNIPDVSEWSGTERLSYRATSLSGLRKKAKCVSSDGKSHKVPTLVAHLGAIGCSPDSTDALGSRLMTLQKALAFQMLPGPTRLLALEAIKPLDTDYYGRFGFQSSTPTFWSVSDHVSLVPMVYKLSSKDELSDLFSDWAPMAPACRNNVEAVSGPWNSAAPIVKRVSDFLWRLRDPEEARACLRTLCRRLKLNSKECQKLWSMRHHSLMYGREGSLPKDPLVLGSDWFESPAGFDETVLTALKAHIKS